MPTPEELMAAFRGSGEPDADPMRSFGETGEEDSPPARPKAPPDSPERMRRRYLERSIEAQTPVLGAVSDLWASTVPEDVPGVADARARTDERISRFWDQATQSDARLGGRDTLDPIVGTDDRAGAPLARLYQMAPVYRTDDAEREELEERASRAVSQAPELSSVGDVAGMAAYAMTPNAPTALGRIGMGAVTGAGVAAAHAPAESALEETVISGLTGGGLSGAAELVNPQGLQGVAGRAGQRMSARADAAQRTADQARLEASGVWGGGAMRAADELPGGRERLAADLRRYGIGERGPGQAGFEASAPPRGLTIPRMDRALDDAATLGRASGSSMGNIAQQIDDAGVRVSTAAVQQRVAGLARELDELPIGGRDAASRLRELTADLADSTEGSMTMSQAWRQRQMLDDMIGESRRDPNLARLTGQLQRIREALHAEMNTAARQAGLGSQWAESSRGSQVGAFMREHGRGSTRLSVGGGMGGADAAGDIVAEAVTSGSPGRIAAAVPRQMAARALSQETRMAFPGVRARVGEASASTQRSIADRLLEFARTRPQDLGFEVAQEIIQAATRGEAALAATTHVLAQRDERVRQALAAEE